MAKLKFNFNQKTAETIIITAVAIVIAFFVYWGVPLIKQLGKTKVPQKYILEAKVNKSYTDTLQTLDGIIKKAGQATEVTQFTTSKTKAELVDFYLGLFAEDGFTVVSESGDPKSQIGVYFISVADYKNNISLNIFLTSENSHTTLVALNYRHGFTYKKR